MHVPSGASVIGPRMRDWFEFDLVLEPEPQEAPHPAFGDER